MRQSAIKLLSEAVTMADAWRGSMTGNPDPTALQLHDHFILACRRVLTEERKAALAQGRKHGRVKCTSQLEKQP